MRASGVAPLRGSYVANAALVLLALCPQIVVSTALDLLEPSIARGLHAGRSMLGLASPLADGGYALGAVIAADLSARFERRALFFVCEGGFVAGAALVALAPSAALVVAGSALAGLATGTLLVVATPSIVMDFPTAKVPVTGVVFLMGFFGATTLGPVLGGIVGHTGLWRPFYGALAAAGVANLALAALVVPVDPPAMPGRRIDVLGLALAAAGTGLAFVGSAALVAGPERPLGWSLAALGLAALAALLVQQYRSDDPFVPVKPLSTAMPLLGLGCAMVSGAAFVALLDLIETVMVRGRHASPLAVGLTLWPAILGAVVAAGVFRMLFRTRLIPVLALGGMAALVAAGALVATDPLVAGSAGVAAIALALGLGAGATVSPSLFLASFGVPAEQIGPTFALVELLRSAAAFLPGPVVMGIALSAAMGSARTATPRVAPMLAAAHVGAWTIAGLTALGALGLVVAFRRFGLELRRPDLQAWHDGTGLALPSPDVAEAA